MSARQERALKVRAKLFKRAIAYSQIGICCATPALERQPAVTSRRELVPNFSCLLASLIQLPETSFTHGVVTRHD